MILRKMSSEPTSQKAGGLISLPSVPVPVPVIMGDPPKPTAIPAAASPTATPVVAAAPVVPVVQQITYNNTTYTNSGNTNTTVVPVTGRDSATCCGHCKNGWHSCYYASETCCIDMGIICCLTKECCAKSWRKQGICCEDCCEYWGVCCRESGLACICFKTGPEGK